MRGKINLLDLNIHSENFYLNFCNELFGFKLRNMNAIKQNAEAIDLIDEAAASIRLPIDLIDETNHIIIQVSSTATKAKVESALSKIQAKFDGYFFKFISISKDASEIRTKIYNPPHNVIFAPETDIYDINSILKVILVSSIEDQRRFYHFIKKELTSEIDISKINTNLATIINILAQEDWDRSTNLVKPFEIDRKIEFNNLELSKEFIEDYKIHHTRVDKIYTEFNMCGVNKSNSVLSSIRTIYLRNKTILSDDDLFFRIIELVIQEIQESSNYTPIPYEELELCVNILVVDAFIRCKIFENPEGYVYAAP